MASGKKGSGAGDKGASIRSKAIPTGRVSRFAKVAKLAGGVAGGMLAEGARQWRAGNRPKARELVLTSSNARRVANQLGEMRGAAMKMGQILSMDSGDLLPRELTEILAKLRAEARSMPLKQLQRSMTDAYGEGWEQVFYGFDYNPIAAASIGQVHRAISPDGREIVLKVQYPGVSQSIDSDVDNIGTILRLSGLLPDGIEIQPLLDDAKIQLHEEADYFAEEQHLEAFGRVLSADERFVLPEVLSQFTRQNVLAMTYVSGSPIESIAGLHQAERDRVMTALIDLMLTELFGLKMMQTDPNFANYLYRKATGDIVLLDFGATRHFKPTFVNNYRKLAVAIVAGDRKKIAAAAGRLGYSTGEVNSDYRELLVDLFMLALEPLEGDEPYDFAGSNLMIRMSQMGESVKDYREFWQAPPIDAIYFHRKLGGMFMLASRLEARVNVYKLLQRWLPGAAR
ncbi:MAG: AarF/ABC1/UbiB kinase family protein [Halieaceae bacterium]|jgi:predicted unusual protein kinase regulating ubiquinone biosynthesis (AarF/ABC1/UbiB family)|nr:AarF/ABC1/UbiB kinase family protein [Halieaceae bacterium]